MKKWLEIHNGVGRQNVSSHLLFWLNFPQWVIWCIFRLKNRHVWWIQLCGKPGKSPSDEIQREARSQRCFLPNKCVIYEENWYLKHANGNGWLVRICSVDWADSRKCGESSERKLRTSSSVSATISLSPPSSGISYNSKCSIIHKL